MDMTNRRVARHETKMICHGGLDMQGDPNYWMELSYRIPGGWATVPSGVEVYDCGCKGCSIQEKKPNVS